MICKAEKQANWDTQIAGAALFANALRKKGVNKKKQHHCTG